jgi:hypothetical protein
MSEHLVQRAAQLDEREHALRQRERELAEQRRILAEECRLLRTRHAPAHPAQRIPAARFDAAPGFWSRVKRVMLGDAAPTIEGS